MTMPGQQSPEFSLSTSFTPRSRPNMAALMAVDSNPQSPGYGTIRVLPLPHDTPIRRPGQGQNHFGANSGVASALSLLREGGSPGAEGHLVTHPLGGRLVY